MSRRISTKAAKGGQTTGEPAADAIAPPAPSLFTLHYIFIFFFFFLIIIFFFSLFFFPPPPPPPPPHDRGARRRRDRAPGPFRSGG